MITILPARHWHQLEDIFDREFDSDLPEAQNAEIFMATDKGKRTGFILAEDIKMVGQIYVYPDFRKESARYAGQMVRFCQERYQGKSVATLASEPRFEKLYRLLGMQKIDGTVFRKN
jgi:hypothetical protein